VLGWFAVAKIAFFGVWLKREFANYLASGDMAIWLANIADFLQLKFSSKISF